MFVELHILQNFAPCNLNRDDTGSPKDCEFGGYRRARISSQAFKRAMRDSFREEGLLPPQNLAKRTRLLVNEVAERLEAVGKPIEEARDVVSTALAGMGLKVSEDWETEYLVFLGENEISRLSDLCTQHWDALASPMAVEEQTGTRRGRSAKRAARGAVPTEVQKALGSILDGGKAADLALFGRMLADLPGKNRDAASQVAHAISTNKVSMEFDFYTAVDDLKPDDVAGADMMGTVEFNSACFYRYANVDMGQLKNNLNGDEELARKTLEAFLRASVAAIPTGKQNSMAAHNPPSFIFAVVRRSDLWNLANAFLKPVYPTSDGDLVQGSIAKLDTYWGRLAKMYGEEGIQGKWALSLDGDGLTHIKNSSPVGNCEQLVAAVQNAVTFDVAEGGPS